MAALKPIMIMRGPCLSTLNNNNMAVAGGNRTNSSRIDGGARDVRHRRHRPVGGAGNVWQPRSLDNFLTSPLLCTCTMLAMSALVNIDYVLAFQPITTQCSHNLSLRTWLPLSLSTSSFDSISILSSSPPTCTATARRCKLQIMMMSNNKNSNDLLPAPLQTLRSSPSKGSQITIEGDAQQTASQPLQFQIQLETLSRILLPSLLSSLLAYLLFPPMSLGLSYLINDSATFAVLSVDSSQFIQNFLTVTGLTFSILVGQTYYFMYQQQEAVFVSLFGEVTEAKSLLEQVALVCQGRKDMYEMCLVAVKRYVEEDLKEGLGKEPAQVLSARPMDDPLEIIMYLTSVGVPSSIYDTVRSLRQARALRLAALQKKLPPVHLLLLWLLAIIELSSFPVLGAGTQTIGGYNILTIEGALFGIMTFGIVLTLNVVGELYEGSGGAYNVDSVLGVMVKGLDEELETRMRDIDGDVMKRAYMSAGEREEVERRDTMVLPSPVYYPMRYSTTFVGEDSAEANSI